MRACSHILLWASLAALGAFWYWGERTYRSQNLEFFSTTLRAIPAQGSRPDEVPNPSGEKAADSKREFDASHRRTIAAYAMWRDTSLCLFAVVLCAAGWVALAPVASATRGRTRRLIVQGSTIGAVAASAIAALAFRGGTPVVGSVYADEYEWAALLNTALMGGISGTLAGALVGGLFAGIKRTSP